MSFNLPIFLGTLILFGALFAAYLLGYMVSQLIRGFLPVDVLTFSVTLFFLVAIAILIYLLLDLIKRQQSPSSPRETLPQPIEKFLEEPFVRRRRLVQLNESSPDIDPQSRLISMLSGDRAAAARLVDRAKLNYPGMPEDWYWHRVIDDLKRERR
jgi:predicted PurR-regulated permease PerM